MQATITRNATVQTGHRIELITPELPEGTEVQITVTVPPETPTPELQARFDALAKQWDEETLALSSSTQIAMHPAYQEIIGMGQAAVPMILHDLTLDTRHWFWALSAITRANPIPPEHQGKIAAMAADWVQWGREQGYLS